MTIHIDWRLHDNGSIRVDEWNLQVAIGGTVGECDCGSPASGQRIVRQRGITWANLTCPKCGESAYPVREMVAA